MDAGQDLGGGFQEAMQIVHPVISESGLKTNLEARYLLYPFTPTLILILLHPGIFTQAVLAVYMTCVSKSV